MSSGCVRRQAIQYSGIAQNTLCKNHHRRYTCLSSTGSSPGSSSSFTFSRRTGAPYRIPFSSVRRNAFSVNLITYGRSEKVLFRDWWSKRGLFHAGAFLLLSVCFIVASCLPQTIRLFYQTLHTKQVLLLRGLYNNQVGPGLGGCSHYTACQTVLRVNQTPSFFT